MEKNIELAISKINEYYHQILDLNDNTENIYAYLSGAGYTNIDEFTFDKSVYLLKHQEYAIVEEPYISSDVPIPYIQEKKPAFLYTIDCGESYVFVPHDHVDDGTFDKYGLTKVSLGYSAEHGVILSFDGDLRIYLIYSDEVDLHSDYFLRKLSDKLSMYFDDVSVDNNDVIINGKKVAGSAELHYNNLRILLFQITFNDNSEIIRAVCGESKKEPGFIDKNVLSPYELKDEFLSWLQ